MKKFFLLFGALLVSACTAAPQGLGAPPSPQAEHKPTAVVTTRVVPIRVISQQGDLVLELELAQDTFYAGEQGQAVVTLRNRGTHSVFTHKQFFNLAARRSDFRLDVLNEKGEFAESFPWYPNIGSGGPPIENELAAGKVLTSKLLFQIPPWAEAKGHFFTIHAVGEATELPFGTESGDRGLINLATEPVSLHILEPGAGQQLRLNFKTAQDGYQLSVTDVTGKLLANPIWTHSEVSQRINGREMHSGLAGLNEFTNGTASGELFGSMFDTRFPLHVRGWVAAPGYVTTVFEQDIPPLNLSEKKQTP